MSARTAERRRGPHVGLVRGSIAAALALTVVSWGFVLFWDRQAVQPFFSSATVSHALDFVRDLLGVGTGRTPDYAQAGEWLATGRLAYETLAMSVLAIGIAAAGALATFMFGSRNVMLGGLGRPTLVTRAVFYGVRLLYAINRGIPELVWAMLLVFVLAPGILPGAIALGIHNAGVLGKLGSEVVEGMDPRPLRALQAAGAGRLHVLAYGVLPEVLPRLLTYLFYRWEVVIRTTIVVGFVAAGGLGLRFRLSMSFFDYTAVTLLLLWYLLLVVAVDLTAAGMRRLAR